MRVSTKKKWFGNFSSIQCSISVGLKCRTTTLANISFSSMKTFTSKRFTICLRKVCLDKSGEPNVIRLPLLWQDYKRCGRVDNHTFLLPLHIENKIDTHTDTWCIHIHSISLSEIDISGIASTWGFCCGASSFRNILLNEMERNRANRRISHTRDSQSWYIFLEITKKNSYNLITIHKQKRRK